MTEGAQTTAAGAAQTPEGTQRPEQTSSEVGRRMSLEACSEVSRKVSLELRRFPTQQIPQELPYRWSDEDLTHYLTHYLPEARYLPEDPSYQ